MPLSRLLAYTLDWGMAGAMYAIQRRHRLHEGSHAELERYVTETVPLTRDEYFRPPAISEASETDGALAWTTPLASGYPENDRVFVQLFPSARGWSAPTILFLHALMSASDLGYRQWAARFNERGWNAAFVHLPFHYSRTPAGHRNGELAITADLVRTGQGLRQAVTELRQLIAQLRARGSREFSVWGLSYGGWIGALLASVEELHSLILMEPIVDVSHAIWHSPAGLAVRRQLRPRGISPELIERHAHLTSPLHAAARFAAQNILLIAGEYDRIAPAEGIARLHKLWEGSEMLTVPQGHFGYSMMREAWAWTEGRGFV
jgi:pimeloyl-ACP methyl ester carboxylesterase